MSNQRQLRQLLVAFFNESELKTLTFDLGIDYEMLPGQTKGDKARELIAELWRSGRLPELIQMGSQMRPNLEWPDDTNEALFPALSIPEAKPQPQPGTAGKNPFTYGNPISNPARFFGRNREVEQIFNRLRNAEAESTSIVGGRRIGKTSLLNYLAHPEVRRKFGMDPDDTIFVYVDLQMVDRQTTPARLWQHLLTQTSEECQDVELASHVREVIDGGYFDTFALADFFDEVDRRSKHIVFLLDEFEKVTSNPNFDPSFFYGLRSLAIQHSLSLVTSSQYELIELTHSQEIRSSPFFNIFANINVRPFTDVEKGRMITTSLAETGIEFTAEELVTLDEVADGHPFFLQVAGHFLFDAHLTHAVAANRRTAWLQAYRAEIEPHCAHFWRTAEMHAQRTLLLLALLSRRVGGRPLIDPLQLESLYPRAGQHLAWLARLGYVIEDSGRYALFSSTFGEWIIDSIRAGDLDRLGTVPVEAAHEALGKLPASARKALVPVLSQVGPGSHGTVIGLIEQSIDAEQMIALLRDGLSA